MPEETVHPFAVQVQERLYQKAATVRCVLLHWSSGYLSRMVAAANYDSGDHEGYRDSCYALLQDRRLPEPILVLLGAHFFPKDKKMRDFTRSFIEDSRVCAMELAVAASYSWLFYVDGRDLFVRMLTERVLASSASIVHEAAARDALKINADIKSGGICSRCIERG